jgi:8-oxo-dGTP diphosphatase
MSAVLDAAYRLVYRLGFRAARAWWGIRRPDHHGVMVAVWAEGRVLMLRSSYRASFDFPGGGIERGEAPLAAVARELREEAGVAAAADAFRFIGEIVAWWDNRRDHVSMFELRLAAQPKVQPDGREIVSAAFMPPAAVLALPISPFVRAYLESAPVS